MHYKKTCNSFVGHHIVMSLTYTQNTERRLSNLIDWLVVSVWSVFVDDQDQHTRRESLNLTNITSIIHIKVIQSLPQA